MQKRPRGQTRIKQNATEAKRSNKNKTKCNRGQEECEHLLFTIAFHICFSHLLFTGQGPEACEACEACEVANVKACEVKIRQKLRTGKRQKFICKCKRGSKNKTKMQQ
jgi:hypothetical protein